MRLEKKLLLHEWNELFGEDEVIDDVVQKKPISFKIIKVLKICAISLVILIALFFKIFRIRKD